MTRDPNNRSEKKLSARESVRNFLNEMRSVIYDHQGSAYIKFINLAIGIEYLGACLDQHDFIKQGESDDRFNNALKKLFPSKYKKYANSNCSIYLYEEFRCAFVHQLRPGKDIVVTHRDESKREGTTHLEKTKSGFLVLVLEDFFDDFEKACIKLFNLEKQGKLPTKKLEQDYIRLINIRDNE